RENEALGLRRDRGEGSRRRGRPEGRVVVLAHCEDVQPDVLGVLRDGDRILYLLSFTRSLTCDRVACDVADGEKTELHTCGVVVRAHIVLQSSRRMPFTPKSMQVNVYETTSSPSLYSRPSPVASNNEQCRADTHRSDHGQHPAA